MNGAELKKAFRDGTRVYGTLIISPHPAWLAAVQAIGLDFVFIDTEHVSIDRVTLDWMCRSYTAIGVAPIVRIPRADPFLACQVLDGGAVGILSAYTESPDDMRALGAVIKNRPLKGKKLADIASGAEIPEPVLDAYIKGRNTEHILIANIESVEAMDKLNEIMSVPSVDGAIIGPHDLSTSLDVPEDYQNPKFDEAVRKVFRIARANGKGAGIHYSYSIDQEIAWAKEGANIMLHSADITLFTEAWIRDLETFKNALD